MDANQQAEKEWLEYGDYYSSSSQSYYKGREDFKLALKAVIEQEIENTDVEEHAVYQRVLQLIF